MLENIFQLYSNMKWKKDMYLYLNVVVYLNDLFRLFARQPLLPLLVKILKKKKVAGLQVTKGTRDLFGRLLFLPAITGIDSEGVFFLSCSPGASTFCIP